MTTMIALLPDTTTRELEPGLIALESEAECRGCQDPIEVGRPYIHGPHVDHCYLREKPLIFHDQDCLNLHNKQTMERLSHPSQSLQAFQDGQLVDLRWKKGYSQSCDGCRATLSGRFGWIGEGLSFCRQGECYVHYHHRERLRETFDYADEPMFLVFGNEGPGHKCMECSAVIPKSRVRIESGPKTWTQYLFCNDACLAGWNAYRQYSAESDRKAKIVRLAKAARFYRWHQKDNARTEATPKETLINALCEARLLADRTLPVAVTQLTGEGKVLEDMSFRWDGRGDLEPDIRQGLPLSVVPLEQRR